MKNLLRGKRGGLIAFLAIAALVVGGLGWATTAALRLESQAQLAEQVRLALWRLDSLVWPALAKEDSRPYSQFSAVYAPSLAWNSDGRACTPGTVIEPSPLVNEELPEWMLLHFQVDEKSGWASPQVLSENLARKLRTLKVKSPPDAVVRRREALLADLSSRLPAHELLARVPANPDHLGSRENTLVLDRNFWENNTSMPAAQMDQSPNQAAYNYLKRHEQQSILQNQARSQVANEDPQVLLENTGRNGEQWFSPNRPGTVRGKQTSVELDAMAPFWLNIDDREERLVLARTVRLGDKQVCQGIVLDWPRLQALLAGKLSDLFPQARVLPVRDETPPHPETTMTALPLELEPGPVAPAAAAPPWTPLRIGLALAWAAALVALSAVGLGGWSLLNLSERRIRFVSAVTHELRTPLTTLRLYLDMLAGGMVREEKQKTEYLQTLNSEADRLNRLVGNVLDFSRLENQRPRLEKAAVPIATLLDQVRSAWQGRCQECGKELLAENALGDKAVLTTDVKLVQQVLGNLIDNACKYSRGAEDPRIALRARPGDARRLILEVEDHGPGVMAGERRSIFRPFRRGRTADVTAGGVGLGLALAQRWARLLGGKLTLQPPGDRGGACFQLRLPF